MNSLYTETITNDIDLDNESGSNYFIIDASSNNINISLPTIGSNGMNFEIIRIDSNLLNTVTFTPKTSQTVNNNSSTTFAVNSYASLVSNDSNWICPKQIITF